MLTTREAVEDDIDGIMKVEEEMFGPVGAAASKEMMLERISKCTAGGWFLVAVEENRVCGYILLQPTHLTPDRCTSWEMATDNGSLASTFVENGENIYVVSLAVRESAPPGTTEFLVHSTYVKWLKTRKAIVMFCSRMPGFAEAHAKENISADDYWQAQRSDGEPRDWMLHRYWEMSGGSQPFRLLRDGFPPDVESGGHGVLFALTDPFVAIKAIALSIHRAGVIAGTREKRKKE